jgi:YkoY family integral membrane protein
MFHQTFEPRDLLVICLLMVLEGLLSMDNALVLGLMARRLPEELRAKALTYGLIGAFIFRLLAIGAASALLRSHVAELLGGLYLLFVSIKHLWGKHKKDPLDRTAVDRSGKPILTDDQTGRPLTERELGEEFAEQAHGQIRNRDLDYADVHSTHESGFWLAVASIELSDLAFAVDSILAAVALVGPPPPGTPPGQLHPKLWVVVVGGMGGVILMRFAAIVFIKLLDRFPRFEVSAYLLVMLIGAKMTADYFLNSGFSPHHVDFNSVSDPGAWVFWGLMAAAFALGFVPKARRNPRRPLNAPSP